jgi:hypothetical protein
MILFSILKNNNMK